MNFFIFILLINSLICGKNPRTSKRDKRLTDGKGDTFGILENYVQGVESEQNKFIEYGSPDETFTSPMDAMHIKPSSDKSSSTDFAVPFFTAEDFETVKKEINNNPTVKQIDQRITDSNLEIYGLIISGTENVDAHSLEYLNFLREKFINSGFIIHFYFFFTSNAQYLSKSKEFILRLIDEIETTFAAYVIQGGLVHQKSNYKLIRMRAFKFLEFLKQNYEVIYDQIIETIGVEGESTHAYLSGEFIPLLEPIRSASMIKKYCLPFIPIEICDILSEITFQNIQAVRVLDKVRDAVKIEKHYLEVNKIMYALADTFLKVFKTPRTDENIKFNAELLKRHDIIRKYLVRKEPEIVSHGVPQFIESESVKIRSDMHKAKHRFEPYGGKSPHRFIRETVEISS